MVTQPNAKLVEVARAMADADRVAEGYEPLTSFDVLDASGQIYFLVLARAAIRALMEPSEDMVEAGRKLCWQAYRGDGVETYQADAGEVYRTMLAKVFEEEG